MSSAPNEKRAPRRKRRRPHVSVCIANWNCRDLLRDCLASLGSRFQGVRVEVVVIDNASVDGAPDMVAREFPRVKLVRNSRNAGFSRANNQAAAMARGRWLFFLNNDTVVPRGTLRDLLRFARDNPEFGVIGPMLRGGDGNPQVSFRGAPTVRALMHYPAIVRWTGVFRGAYRDYRGRNGDFTTTRPVDVLMGAALLMRRGDFRAHGPWDENYVFGGEDIDLCVRLGRHKPVVYHPAIEITHFGRVSSRQHLTYAQPNMLIGIARFLRKNGANCLAMTAFKAAMTLDAPVQVLRHGAQYLLRRLRGKSRGAQKSLLCLRADVAFLKVLPRFWAA